MATLANMGLTLGEIFDLDEIADDCALDKVVLLQISVDIGGLHG